MGLLDDAIREHLDLKRRRGADPAEVERLAREALGPVRRNRDPSSPGDPEAEALSSGTAFDEPDEPVDADVAEEDALPYDQPADGWAYDDDQTRIAEPPAADESAPGAPPRLEFADEDEPFSQPAAADETTEYDVEEALAAEEAPEDGESVQQPEGDEDVLEETPEFLQDTPDHDRLWFEQRPPRDFDFDG